ncbi:hypothetical protein C7G41_00040 [Bradyrhizobium sp. MOS002]|nr:hypothetical protein C7G41_00040 [Bradyrhizobium sp. MOS002]
MEAAKPLQPHQRSDFLREVAAELARHEIGPGIVGRVVGKLQRRVVIVSSVWCYSCLSGS